MSRTVHILMAFIWALLGWLIVAPVGPAAAAPTHAERAHHYDGHHDEDFSWRGLAGAAGVGGVSGLAGAGVGAAGAAAARGVFGAVTRRAVAANAGSRLLSPSSLADEVVNATGGVLKTNKGGFTVEIPHGARGITVRVMERGGSRTNYYRVSVPGKETYTVTGEASTDAALTHIGITGSSLDDILSIVARIKGGA